MLDNTLKDLEGKRADEYRISLVKQLLQDVAEWINNELKDPDFEANDEAFRQANDYRFGNYNPGNNRYRIAVPLSHPTGTRWVRRDEFVEGTNLSGLQPSSETTNIKTGVINKEDYKQAISLLTRNYVNQLTVQGLAHSDVHPGNFRITPDNQSLVIFDRYNMLEFNPAEQQLLKQIIQAIAGGNPLSAVQGLVTFFMSLPQNQQLDKVAVDQSIKDLLADSSDFTETGPKILLSLKQQGVQVPLKYTLVMKNILALQRLSRQAGFGNIAEAFLNTATPAEIMSLVN